MGFKRSTLKLEFTGEFEGLEVRAKRFSIGEHLLLLKLSARMEDGDESAISEVHQLLNKKIIRWNFEEDVYDDDEGEPTGETRRVPKNMEGLAELDRPLLTAIIRGIVTGSVNVPAPLETPSDGGDPEMEASIPMDVSSPSL